MGLRIANPSIVEFQPIPPEANRAGTNRTWFASHYGWRYKVTIVDDPRFPGRVPTTPEIWQAGFVQNILEYRVNATYGTGRDRTVIRYRHGRILDAFLWPPDPFWVYPLEGTESPAGVAQPRRLGPNPPNPAGGFQKFTYMRGVNPNRELWLDDQPRFSVYHFLNNNERGPQIVHYEDFIRFQLYVLTMDGEGRKNVIAKSGTFDLRYSMTFHPHGDAWSAAAPDYEVAPVRLGRVDRTDYTFAAVDPGRNPLPVTHGDTANHRFNIELNRRGINVPWPGNPPMITPADVPPDP